MPCIFCTHDLQVVVPLLGRIDLRQDSPVQITKHISPQDAQTYPLTREEMYIPSPAASPLGESISKKSRLYRSTPLYAAAENVSHPPLPRLPSHTIHGVQLANPVDGLACYDSALPRLASRHLPAFFEFWYNVVY